MVNLPTVRKKNFNSGLLFEQLIIDYTKIEAYMLKTVNVGNCRKDDAMCSMFTHAKQVIGKVRTILL
jgi:hypothetical protein